MDEKTKELISIGASVAGHCQPCLTFHVKQAIRLGVSDDEIMEAVTVGKMIQKGAMSAMNKFAKSILEGTDDSLAQSPQKNDSSPNTLKVFDPAMCCSTGICGPKVDSALVEFAGAVKAVAEYGIAVERWNLAQQPQAFAQDLQVKKHLTELGHKALPFIYINDELKLTGRYPTTKELFALLELAGKEKPDIGIQAGGGVKPFAMLGADNEKANDGPCCADGGCCS